MQPSAAGVSIWAITAIGVGALLAGVVIWYLPWARWSMRATLWLVPLALLCVALSNMAGGQDPWEWDLYFLVVFVWIGICQRPGVSLGMLPLFAVAYLAPLYPTHQTSAMALSSVIYVGIVCAVVGESIAWVSLRWRQAESELGMLMGNLPGMAYNCANDPQWTMRFVSAGCEALTGYAPQSLVDNARRGLRRSGVPRRCAPALGRDPVGDRWWRPVDLYVSHRHRGRRAALGVGARRGRQGRQRWGADARRFHPGRDRPARSRGEAHRRGHRVAPDLRRDARLGGRAGRCGVVQRCNKAATELAGREFDGVIGRHCYEVFHGAHRFIADCPQRRSQVSGQTESSIMRRSERWWRVTFEPAFDAAGEFAGGIEVVSDITELKQAEQGLIDSLLRVQALSEQTIAAIAGIVEIRDPYTAGHQQRVSELGAAIAEQLGLDADTVVGVRVAGLVHDVGKISVPTEILNKPGRLSEPEFALIKGHAQAGYEILGAIEFPWPVAQVVRQHHERLDGSGYPQGLRDGDILLEARILAVADVVEAMASTGLTVRRSASRPRWRRSRPAAESAMTRRSLPLADLCLRMAPSKSTSASASAPPTELSDRLTLPGHPTVRSPLADPANTTLKTQEATLFQGTTLRGLLLNAYALGTVATIAGTGAIASFAGAAILLVLSGLGFAHARRVGRAVRAPAAVAQERLIKVA